VIEAGDKGYVIRPLKYAGAYAEVIVAGQEYLRVRLLKTYINPGGKTRGTRKRLAAYQGDIIRARYDEFRVTEPINGEA